MDERPNTVIIDIKIQQFSDTGNPEKFTVSILDIRGTVLAAWQQEAKPIKLYGRTLKII